MVPTVVATAIVQATRSVGSVLAVAALGIVGPRPSTAGAERWSSPNVGRPCLARGGRWTAAHAGLANFLSGEAINLLGDGVREAFDPQSERGGAGGGYR